MRVVILHDRVGADCTRDEQDVLVQAELVSRALTQLGHEPLPLALSLNLAETAEKLLHLKPDIVFNLVETIEGKGNLIACGPLVLDNLGLPYTGAQAEAMFLTSGKITAKKMLRAAGIATPDWLTLESPWPEELNMTRWIVKSNWEHASLGLDESALSSLGDRKNLQSKIREMQRQLGGSCFAEAFIEGRELNLSLLAGKAAPEVLPPAEIIFDEYPPDKNRIVCYRAKWIEDSFEYRHTPRSFDFPPEDEPMLKQLADISRHCWIAFNLNGYARVDFRIDNTGRPWVLEVNANPCLSPEGGFVAAAERVGIDHKGLVERIIKDIPGQDAL